MKATYSNKTVLFLAAGTACFAAACAADDDPSIHRESGQIVVFSDDSTCVTLYAGQTINAGTVCASIDNDDDTSAMCGSGATGSMTVTYETVEGWELVEAHLAAGDDLVDIPANRKGNPKIGNFRYHSGDISGATSYSFSVPLCDFGLDNSETICEPVTAYLASHAALRRDNGDGTYQTETGWGDGDRFVQRGSWAEYFNLVLECTDDDQPPPPPPMDCETAFALGDECFLDIDQDDDGNGDFNRWGWRQHIDGSYVADVYAGAGRCDTGKGTLVGSLSVDVNPDGTVSASFNTLGDFVMDETHLYVGTNLPVNASGDTTVAPGQYTDLHEELGGATSDSYTLPGRAGDYLIAHAVVCGPF